MNTEIDLLQAGSQDTIPTGFFALDDALGIGGLPRGQVIEISGEPDSGKTSFCLHIIAQAQKAGAVCVYIDADHRLDAKYAGQLGVNPETLFISEPTCAEQALETTLILARCAAITLIVLDSLSGMTPFAELQAPINAPVAPSLDELLRRYLPRFTVALSYSRASLIITVPVEHGMSHVYHHLAGNLSRLALPLSAAVRMRLVEQKTADKKPARRTRIEIIKNKFAPCFKTIDLDIIVNRTINKPGELLRLGEELAILSRRGSSYVFFERSIGKDRAATLNALQHDPDLAGEIEQAIRQRLKI